MANWTFKGGSVTATAICGTEACVAVINSMDFVSGGKNVANNAQFNHGVTSSTGISQNTGAVLN